MKYSGLNTSQPYVSKVLLENLPDGQLKAIVRVALKKDTMSGDSENSMKTSIVKIADTNIIKRFTQDNKDANIELIENSRKTGKFGNLDRSIAEVKVLPNKLRERENDYYIATAEFIIDINVKNLTFYVICQHNSNHPSYSEIASSRTFKRKILDEASIVAEDVYRDGTLVRKSTAFICDDINKIQKNQRDYSIVRGPKTYWTGPVKYYSNNNPRSDGYVGYAGHGLTTQAQQPKLSLVEVPNTTIHDYRVLENISRVPFNCKINENRPLAHKKNAYFSNLCITNDRDGLVKMFFAVNVAEIVKNNIKIPRFVSVGTGDTISLDTSKIGFKEVLNLSNFNKMSLQRHQIKASGELLKGGIDEFIERIVESTQVGTTLSNSVDAKISNRSEVNKVEIKALGAVREIDNLFLKTGQGVSNDVRFFTVSDLSMTDRKKGIYKYSINLDIQDGSIIYLKNLYESLKEGSKAFQIYHSSLMNKTALETSFFRNEEGPWVWALKNLVKAVRSFDDDGALMSDTEIEKLYILASPRTCTLESVSKVAKIYEQITSKLQHLVGELPNKSKRDPENMKPNSLISGNRVSSQMINIEHTFTERYELTDGNETGYDYLSTARTTTPGLLTVSSQQYNLRALQETMRYFNTRNNQTNALEYSYLTPAVLKVENRLFKTYETDAAGQVRNNTELANFNALLDLFLYKNHGKAKTEFKQTLIEAEKSEASDCLSDSLFSKQLNSFSTHVKNNLSFVMSTINVVGEKKYDSPCFEKTEQQEKEYAKLMMPNTTSSKYKSELSSRGDKEPLVNDKTNELVNLSSIFTPLFYMKHLRISKDLCCFVEKINKVGLNGLPNQLKAMNLSNQSITKHAWYDNSGKSSLKTLNNAAFYYLNNKNLVTVELLIGFDQGNIKSPIWVELKNSHFKTAASVKKTNLLCRLRPYTNEALCFVKNEFLNLNIFNQCFLLDVSQVQPSTPRTAVKRRPLPEADKLTSLAKNNFLKLESNFMRTNLMFGQVVKQINSLQKNTNTKTEQTKQKQTTHSTQQSSISVPNTIMGTSGGNSGGGSY